MMLYFAICAILIGTPGYYSDDGGLSAFHMVSAFDVLPKVLENLVKTSWSYQTNDLQCARDVLRNRSISLAGFLFHSDDGRCTRLLWGQSQGTKVDGHDRIFLINDGRSCRDVFQLFDIKSGKHGDIFTCLKTSTEKYDYDSASYECNALGGHLASVKTPEKVDIVSDLAQGEKIWVGLDDRTQEGVFVWHEDGQVLSDSLKEDLFALGQPSNNQGMEHCVHLRLNARDLNNAKCSFEFIFACEMRPGL